MGFTREEALKELGKYIDEGLEMFPPFKGYAMNIIQFAVDKPEMFKYIFEEESNKNKDDYMEEIWQIKRIIPYIETTFEIESKDALWVAKNAMIYAYGLSMLSANNSSLYSREEIARNLGSICRGMIMQIKAPKDDRVGVLPSVGNTIPGAIAEYYKGKKNVIIGFGDEKQLYQIRLDAIFYFEAVGEKVFAYTEENVYEIKQRLYQIEDGYKGFDFVRASKSLVINIKKVESIAPERGGRGKINMLNGESVIASRYYYKSIVDTLSNPVQ